MNSTKILIKENDLDFARKICNEINENDIRNRSVANVLATKLATNIFEGYEIDTESSLTTIPQFLLRNNISDIYINNCYIDIRLCLKDSELKIPRDNFDKELFPTAYMFIKIDENISTAEVLGFITPDNVNRDSVDLDYYNVDISQLVPYYDIETLLINQDEYDIPTNFEIQIFDYLDGKQINEKNFYKVLLNNRTARLLFKKAAKAKSTFNYVSITNISINNSTNELSTRESEIDLQEQNFIKQANTEDAILNDITTVDELDSNNMLELEKPVTNDSLMGLEFSKEQEINLLLNDETADLNISLSKNLENKTEQYSFNNSFTTDVTASLSSIENKFLTEESNEGSIEETPVIITNETSEKLIMTENLEIALEEDSLNDNVETSNYCYDDNDNNIKTKSNSSERTAQNNFIEDITNETQTEQHSTVEDAIEYLYEKEEPNYANNTKSQTSKFTPLILLGIILASTIGYFGYQKLSTNEIPTTSTDVKTVTNSTKDQTIPDKNQKAVPMPIETVENIKTISNNEEAIVTTSPTISALEQNLGKPVSITNLTINWEVPSNYANSTTAKRYLTKIGKIIQLNLKTELLLLDKSPLTNKIMLELTYNKNSGKFDIKGFITSSGEKSIDNIIEAVVKKALNINLKNNMSSFENFVGNPVLIIRL